MAIKKGVLAEQFKAGVRDYLSLDARICHTDPQGQVGRRATVGALTENCFYYFDAEAMSALARTIEDLALEEATGRLVSAFQDFKQFELQRERYEQLAVTIDQTTVIAAGRVPRSIRRLEFLRDVDGACRGFHVHAYEGKETAALVMCRQMEPDKPMEEADHLGFYTFNARLVSRLRRQLLEVARGTTPALREFDRLLGIDRVAKQLDLEFMRHRASVDAAVRRLQIEGGGYSAGQLVSHLEKGLTQLGKWQNRLPDLLA